MLFNHWMEYVILLVSLVRIIELAPTQTNKQEKVEGKIGGVLIHS